MATLVSVEGTVEVRKASQSRWIPAALSDIYSIGDSIRVLAFSRAAIRLPDETVLRLDQNTTVTFAESEDENRSWLELLWGVIHIISRDPRALKVITPFANAGLEGTEFLVEVTADETRITVFEGEVSVTTNFGDASVMSGERVSAAARRLLVTQVMLQPRDSVQWTLYYAPVLVRPLPAAAQEADAGQAGDAQFYSARAARRLAVGRVDDAEADISQALGLDSGNADAMALRSIIALTRNDGNAALELAQQAVVLDARSAAARIALSYAHQARFDLAAALDSLQTAVELDPANALGWARLSELWLALGDLDQSLEAAHTAASLSPNLAHTQTVLGFAYLSRIEIEMAQDAFATAIVLDPAAPLPHLGLGLALIRQGELIAGRAEIELAVILDPGNALIRSYMGKAYYEEKRDSLSASQLDMSKQLDPLDPTPWFYDAIRKQTVNRPVEALQDLQKSIELNDNRAVYRSRLLLDEDLAARSASQARIYDDLGFRQLALVEGWKSIDADPGNFSAHRVLADLYSILPRHDTARESELLQSQLWQPLSINPAQGRLSDIGSFVLQGTGPTDPSFNEFTPLFTYDQFVLRGSAVAGSNDTLGNEFIASGIADNISYSLSHYRYETDGFRENNDQEQTQYSAFIQADVASGTNLQAEFSKSNIDRGDLALLIDPENFLPTLREAIDDEVIRLGLNQALAANSNLLVSAWYQERDFDLDIDSQDVSNSNLQGLRTEVQYLIKLQEQSLISGLGYFDGDREDTETFRSGPVTFTENIRQANVYAYSLIDSIDQLSLTLGASFEDVDSDFVDKDQFNPKFGLTWNPVAATTVRFAAFKTLQKSLISDQTLEPTTIAGFNQFFADTEGAEATRYGIGVDHRFNPNWYGGVELSKRELEVPGLVFQDGTFVVEEGELDEKFDRAYLYWTPVRAWALTMEYQREEFDREEDFVFAEQIRQLTTQRVLLGVSYFHGSGISARLTTTHVDQDGSFGSGFGFGEFVDDGDRFEVVDLTLDYRLPKRRGLISVGVNNLFDEEFKFQDTDPANPQLLPDQYLYARLNLVF